MMDRKGFIKRLTSMIKVDFKRMFKSRIFYILIGCSLLIPIIMVTMISTMDGTVSIDQQTGVETIIRGPSSSWEAIGSLPGVETNEVMSMCNINMMFVLAAVFVCLFISSEFSSGFAKNLFTIREKKIDYIISKSLCGFICGTSLLLIYFIGAMIAGAFNRLSFNLGTLNVGNIVMCLLAKIFIMNIFISIYVLISVSAKKKAWLSIVGSIGGAMLLFMMVSIITPLNSTILNVIMCLIGGLIFAIGLGSISNIILKKTKLV